MCASTAWKPQSSGHRHGPMAGAQRSPPAPGGPPDRPGGLMAGRDPELPGAGPALCRPFSSLGDAGADVTGSKRCSAAGAARSPPARPRAPARAAALPGAPRPERRGDPAPSPEGTPAPRPLGLAVMQAHPDGKPWQREREFSCPYPPPRGPSAAGGNSAPAASPNPAVPSPPWAMGNDDLPLPQPAGRCGESRSPSPLLRLGRAACENRARAAQGSRYEAPPARASVSPTTPPGPGVGDESAGSRLELRVQELSPGPTISDPSVPAGAGAAGGCRGSEPVPPGGSERVPPVGAGARSGSRCSERVPPVGAGATLGCRVTGACGSSERLPVLGACPRGSPWPLHSRSGGSGARPPHRGGTITTGRGGTGTGGRGQRRKRGGGALAAAAAAAAWGGGAAAVRGRRRRPPVPVRSRSPRAMRRP
ncbi:basic salivary proline-rich protein 1-like [Corvus hawaiiensis]|uniref:basic salivary proline-rich protein 1-like n=1 Tax=Corvus hawaiiensis TaxID=134902 RepID=UPI0020191FA0|nr:basic salivary proline-rich protein 1-like [Corvus hawaiiensis]